MLHELPMTMTLNEINTILNRNETILAIFWYWTWIAYEFIGTLDKPMYSEMPPCPTDAWS